MIRECCTNNLILFEIMKPKILDCACKLIVLRYICLVCGNQIINFKRYILKSKGKCEYTHMYKYNGRMYYELMFI